MTKDKEKIFLGLIFVLLVIIYAPQVGTGFVTDDFTWLDNTVSNGKVDYLRPFTITTGFFRPLVNLTFGIQYQLHGMNPRPYGWFNLSLHLANILLLYLLLSNLEMTRPYAIWAAIFFGINAKGPTMAVGWISGCTTLLYTFFSLLALYLYLKTRLKQPGPGLQLKGIFRYFLVGLFYFAALLSKESAVVVPILVFLVSFFAQKGKEKVTGNYQKKVFWGCSPTLLKRASLSTLVFLVPLVLYLALRWNSNAMTPFNAPDHYRYSLDPLMAMKNLWEYITRAGMLDLLIAAWFFLVLLFYRGKVKPVEGFDRWLFLLGVGWFLVFLLPIILIPARSDIYVYLPQVGLHLAVLPVIVYSWKRMGLPFRRGIRQAGILLPVGILFLASISQLVVVMTAYSQRGRHSVEFTQKLQNTLNINGREQVYIIDTEARERYSPTHTVSYGFPSLLRLYFPGKNLAGEIILPEETAKLKEDPKTVIFTWKGER